VASDEKELTVFVAMPGTDLGPTARWTKPEYVRRFYEKAGEALERGLSRKVRLVVEKERRQGGVIHETMYREAFEADVYIADLTGANPNVFLELGVRFALRRGITLLLSQDTAKAPFDVGPLRIIQYADRPEEEPLGQIVDFVRAGLSDPDHCDSPVMTALDLKVVKRSQWDKVASERVRRLLDAAARESDQERRLALLRQAVEEDSWSVEARMQHVIELRKLGRLEEARKEAEKGIAAGPRHAPFHLQLGLVLGKLGRHVDAVNALSKAVDLDGSNRDALSSLGGALRRAALLSGPEQRDHGLLKQAIEQYKAALALDRHDTYPALNLVRLYLLVADHEPEATERANALLDRLRHLCAFEVVEAPDDHWRRFDLADTHLLRGESAEGLAAYGQAIAMVAPAYRPATLEAPLSTLNELLAARALPPGCEPGVRQAIDLLEAGRSGQPGLRTVR
jgi:tetratricopeptide (TPR) repeat protein